MDRLKGKNRRPMVSAIVLALVLVGCGGGGDAQPTAISTEPPTRETGNRTFTPAPTMPPANDAAVMAQPDGDHVIGITPTATLIVPAQCMYDANGDGMMTVGEFEESMNCVIPLYTWPDEQRPDPAQILIMMNLPTDAPSQFERGMDHNMISGQNVCAWERYWVVMTDAGNTAEADRAFAFLRDEVPHYAETIPGYPPDMLDSSITSTYDEMIRQAELGNTAPLRNDSDNLCGALTIDYQP